MLFSGLAATLCTYNGYRYPLRLVSTSHCFLFRLRLPESLVSNRHLLLAGYDDVNLRVDFNWWRSRYGKRLRDIGLLRHNYVIHNVTDNSNRKHRDSGCDNIFANDFIWNYC